ncbi:MAG: sigma-54 interaction domain-containing protein [Eubacteriaceae bacterium]
MKEEKLKNGTQYRFENMIGDSFEIAKSIMQAKVVAETMASVLISGETGTGKEVFAQSIHNRSLVSDKPFIPINCGAIPENLLESTLFGTCKGAYTGALEQKGLFETASGGTVFLDEINSMSLNLQGKLLRVLEMKKFMKVGGIKEIDSKVRIIGALNESPETALKENRLRSDLYYRLAVFSIEIPPLRNRGEDVLKLVNHYLYEGAVFLNKRTMDISPTLKRIFLEYQWPGNVRELKHMITETLYLVDENVEVLDMEHLSQGFLKKVEKFPFSNHEIGLKEQLDDFEREVILRQLKNNNGNITKTAKCLKISRQNLQNKLRKYGARQ